MGVTAYPTTINIFDDAAWLAAGNTIEVATFTNVTQRPRFIIEYVGRAGRPPVSYNGNSPDTRQYAFQVTAVGWGEGAAPTARYYLQSSFRMPLL